MKRQTCLSWVCVTSYVVCHSTDKCISSSLYKLGKIWYYTSFPVQNNYTIHCISHSPSECVLLINLNHEPCWRAKKWTQYSIWGGSAHYMPFFHLRGNHVSLEEVKGRSSPNVVLYPDSLSLSLNNEKGGEGRESSKFHRLGCPLFSRTVRNHAHITIVTKPY